MEHENLRLRQEEERMAAQQRRREDEDKIAQNKRGKEKEWTVEHEMLHEEMDDIISEHASASGKLTAESAKVLARVSKES